MAVVKLTAFKGEIPKIDPRLLPDNNAQRSTNARLESGNLSPYRKPKFVERYDAIPAGDIKTIYRHGTDWLAWDKPVYLAPGPVAGDRLYIFGDGAPKMNVGGTTYPLALPAPTVALTATPSGTGTGDVTTRLYVYTEVTDFGEETAPCPLSNSVNWQSGITVTLSGFRSIPVGSRVTKQRIYRSQTNLNGADLYFIAERAATNSNYVDSIPANGFAEALPTLGWTPPPDDLTGLIPLPGGGMAAFRGKELWFCQPWQPHAWPDGYVLTMDYDIVALGAFGTSIVVATTGQPYLVDGQSPDSMQEAKLEVNLPCINARGMVDLGYAVAYPSHDGMVVASSAGTRVVTDNIFTRDQWLKTSPETFVSAQFYGKYWASYDYVDPLGGRLQGSFILDLTGQEADMQRTGYKADATWYDIKSGALFLCIGQDIFEWDAIGQTNEILNWRSKKFILPRPTNFGVIFVEGSTETTQEEQAAIDAQRAALLAQNMAIFGNPSISGELNGAEINAFAVNGAELNRLEPERYVSVTVYAGGRAIWTTDKLNEIDRLPSGFKEQQWEVEVNANADISQVTIAGTVTELMQA